MSTLFVDDPLRRMTAYRLAEELFDHCFADCVRLDRNRITALIAPQLYRAVGSIGANLSEGYSRSSGRDRARLFEYSLGSARESLFWYRAGDGLIEPDLLAERRRMLHEVRRILLVAIPAERHRLIRKTPPRTEPEVPQSAVRSPESAVRSPQPAAR